MHFILVDTADARGCLALFRDGQLLQVTSHPEGEDSSSWLLPAVGRVLSEAALSLADLNAYAVCSGPGSFTGLRVGLTTVKAWAEIFQKPIVAVSRLEALACPPSADAATLRRFVAAFLDARRKQVFAALFDPQGVHLVPETVTGLANFVTQADEICESTPVAWRTPDPQLLEQEPLWASRLSKGDTLESIQPPFGAQLGALAYRKLLTGQITDAVSLDANYVRRSDAELFWKDHASAVKA
jgi:tRNA threonylcarbamoyladenosine biosynthesis protein TsaB